MYISVQRMNYIVHNSTYIRVIQSYRYMYAKVSKHYACGLKVGGRDPRASVLFLFFLLFLSSLNIHECIYI